MDIPSFLPAVASVPATQPGDAARRNAIDATMTCQEADFWCWAAITQAVERWVGRTVAQSDIATDHVSRARPGAVCMPGSDDDPLARCGDPCAGSCNSPHILDRVLAERGLLAGPPRDGPPAFDDVVGAIDARKPLPVRMRLGQDDGHFVCVIGYADDGAGRRFVDVLDPLVPGVGDGDASPIHVSFDAFVDGRYSIRGELATPNLLYDVPSGP